MKGVYEIRCKVNGRVYVGSSFYIERRFHEHFKHLNNGKHSNPKLLRDFELYGRSEFETQILEIYEGNNRLYLYELEDIWINKAKFKYNLQSATAHLKGENKPKSLNKKVRIKSNKKINSNPLSKNDIALSKRYKEIIQTPIERVKNKKLDKEGKRVSKGKGGFNALQKERKELQKKIAERKANYIPKVDMFKSISMKEMVKKKD